MRGVWVLNFSRYQNHEPNNPFHFINYPASAIPLQQHKWTKIKRPSTKQVLTENNHYKIFFNGEISFRYSQLFSLWEQIQKHFNIYK